MKPGVHLVLHLSECMFITYKHQLDAKRFMHFFFCYFVLYAKLQKTKQGGPLMGFTPMAWWSTISCNMQTTQQPSS